MGGTRGGPSFGASVLAGRARLEAPVLLAALLLLVSSACLPAGESIAWPDGDYVRWFVLEGPLDGMGSLEIVAAFSKSESPEHELALALAHGQPLYFVGFDVAHFEALHPDLDLDRIAEVVLETRPSDEVFDEACAALGVLGPEQTLSWPLEGRADVFAFEGGGWSNVGSAPGLDRLAFRVPLRQRCSSLSLDWRPYGPTSPYFVSSDRVGGYDQPIALKETVGIGPGHIVSSVDPGLLSIHRGQPYVDDGSHLLGPDFFPTGDASRVWTAQGLVRDRSGSLLVSTTLEYATSHEVLGLGLVEVELDGEVFGVTRPLFEVPGTELKPRGLVSGADGRYVMVASNLVITATSARASERAVEVSGLDPRCVAYHPTADPSLLIGADLGGVWVGRPESVADLRREETGFQGYVYRVGFVDGVPYASPLASAILRREADRWQNVPVYLPESAAECAGKDRHCGRLMPGPYGVGDLVGLNDGTGRFVYSFETCGTVMIVEPRPIEACVSALTVPISTLAEDQLGDVDSISLIEGNAVITGDRGLLYEVLIDE